MKKIIRILAVVLAVVMMVSCFTGCQKQVTAKLIDIELTQEDYAFGVDKNQPELLAKTNKFIAKIMEDGTFDEICNKYFGDGTPTPVESAKEDSSKDQLVVATNAEFEPFEYKSGDKFLGIDMEIAKLLADELGLELVIKHMKFEAVCLSVGQQKCDIAMAGLTVNEERKEYVTFTDPYYKASQKIIVPSDNTEFDDCKTAEDVEKILNKKDKETTIGVQNGTTGQLYVLGDADWGFDGYKVECKGYSNGSMAVQDMLNGNVSYVIIDAAPAACIVENINALN